MQILPYITVWDYIKYTAISIMECTNSYNYKDFY